MVIVELHRGQEPKEEVDVFVETRGGILMGIDLERGEIPGQNVEGKIRKKAQASPKLNFAHKINSCTMHKDP